MRRRVPEQTSIEFRAHGGRRRGAGRKPNGEKAGVPHRPRAERTRRDPVLVTMKVLRGVWNLRTRRAFARIVEALARTCAARRLRVVQYSVQSNHVHLLVEHDEPATFSRGVQGLAVRIAKRLNAMMGRRGKVFADRFHDRVLTSARQVRNALAYVLCNARKHGHAPTRRGWRDPFSTAAGFDGWSDGTTRPDERHVESTRPARTWLLRVGWLRAGGLLDVDHRPGAWSAT